MVSDEPDVTAISSITTVGTSPIDVRFSSESNTSSASVSSSYVETAFVNKI
tara:strand:- start:709 stop:861 length:153 start_codon:yes stop_codon:yes gene_type:complete